MRTIAFVSCVKTKEFARVPARAMFSGSALFRLSYMYAQAMSPDRILILSTEYDLIEPEELIEPYDRSPNVMDSHEWVSWAKRVVSKLSAYADPMNDRFIFVTGAKYYRYVAPSLGNSETPLAGMTIGRRLQFLKSATTGTA